MGHVRRRARPSNPLCLASASAVRKTARFPSQTPLLAASPHSPRIQAFSSNARRAVSRFSSLCVSSPRRAASAWVLRSSWRGPGYARYAEPRKTRTTTAKAVAMRWLGACDGCTVSCSFGTRSPGHDITHLSEHRNIERSPEDAHTS